jgi:hypothetical protein
MREFTLDEISHLLMVVWGGETERLLGRVGNKVKLIKK